MFEIEKQELFYIDGGILNIFRIIEHIKFVQYIIWEYLNYKLKV